MSATYIHSRPKARKPHRCEDCGRTIHPGEQYVRTFAVDGNVWTYIECAHCVAIVPLIEWEDDGYTYDNFDCWEPRTVADLRLKAQWRKRWTRLDGSLYPIPDLTS